MAKVDDFYPKGILVDIDKTLTNSKKEITTKTRETINLVNKSSIKFGVATGRHFAAIKKYVLPLFTTDSLHITSGGGQIVTPSGEIVWKKLIADETANKVIETVESLGGGVIFGFGNCLYYSQKAWKNLGHNYWDIDRRLYDTNEKYEFSLISVVQLNPDLKAYIENLKDLTVKFLTSNSGKEYFDITDAKVNKATTAAKWAELSGIGMEEIAAVGDGNNDVELISAVGMGVAMGNSPDYLKAAAKKVIGATDDDGLAKYVNSLLDGKP